MTRTRLSAALTFALLCAAPLSAQDRRFELDTLRVTVGSRADAAAPVAARSVEVIDRRAIARAPARTINDVLAWAFGVEILARSPAQADVAIRGSTFEQVLVLVDGVPVSDDQTGHFDLDLAIPLEAVERIEILRGPGSALYGPDAVGGTINIITARESAGRVRVEGGTFGTAAIEGDGSIRIGQLGLLAGGGWGRSDGHRMGTDDRVRTLRIGVDAPIAQGTLRTDFGYAGRDFGANGFYGPFDSYEETRTLLASTRWFSTQERTFSIEPRLHLRRHEDDFILRRDDPAFYRNLHTNLRAGGEFVARYRPASIFAIAAGTSTELLRLESTRLGEVDESRAAAFSELTLGNHARASLVASLRMDWHSSYGWFASPSLAAAIRLADPVRIRASADRGLRAPTWTERFYNDPANIGDPDLRPERFWAVEAGIAYAPGRGAIIDGAIYFRSADRLIDWVKPANATPSTPWQIRNIERATFRGVELLARVPRVLAADWTVRFTHLDIEDREAAGFTSKYALRPLTSSASLEAAFALAPGFGLVSRFARNRRAPQDPYFLADVRLSLRRGSFTAFLDATNLADSDPLDVSGFPAPGRAFRFGLRAER